MSGVTMLLRSPKAMLLPVHYSILCSRCHSHIILHRKFAHGAILLQHGANTELQQFSMCFLCVSYVFAMCFLCVCYVSAMCFPCVCYVFPMYFALCCPALTHHDTEQLSTGMSPLQET